MSTATKTTKGFRVTCPFCGDVEATVSLDLNDLKALTCHSCDEEFSPTEAMLRVEGQLARWRAVARWVEMAGECPAE